MQINNILSEEAVLGSALTNRDLAYHVASYPSTLFDLPEHREVHSRLTACLRECGNPSPEYLTIMGASPVVIRNLCEKAIPDSAKLLPSLVQLAKLRALKSACDATAWQISNNNTNSSVLLTSIIDAVSSIESGKSGSAVNLVDLLKTVKENPAPEKHPTPWGNLNLTLQGGLDIGSYVLIVAEANVGKTLLLCQLSGYLSQLGYNIVFFSLEQPAIDIGRRLYAQYKDGLGEYAKNVRIFTDCYDIGAIVSRMALEAKDKKTVFCIDHIQNIQTSERVDGSVQRIEAISKSLVVAIRRTGCTTLVVSEVNRRPGEGLDRIRGSGALEHDIDIGLFLDKALTPDEVKLTISKNRNGPTGTVFLYLHRPTLSFVETPT